MIKLILVFIISCVSLSDACSCMPVVIKDSYCNSKFVGTIKVLNSGSKCELTDESTQICYKIAVVKQFRGDVIKPNILQTANNSAACGVTLKRGHVYFVATNPIESNTLTLNLCQLKEDWTGFSAVQLRTGTQNYYEIRCPKN